jgi:hypothetical protein
MHVRFGLPATARTAHRLLQIISGSSTGGRSSKLTSPRHSWNCNVSAAGACWPWQCCIPRTLISLATYGLALLQHDRPISRPPSPASGTTSLRPYEVDALADYIAGQVMGSGPVTRAECQAHFKSQMPAACYIYLERQTAQWSVRLEWSRHAPLSRSMAAWTVPPLAGKAS